MEALRSSSSLTIQSSAIRSKHYISTGHTINGTYMLDIYRETETFCSLTIQDSTKTSKIDINIGLTVKIGYLFQDRKDPN